VTRHRPNPIGASRALAIIGIGALVGAAIYAVVRSNEAQAAPPAPVPEPPPPNFSQNPEILQAIFAQGPGALQTVSTKYSLANPLDSVALVELVLSECVTAFDNDDGTPRMVEFDPFPGSQTYRIRLPRWVAERAMSYYQLRPTGKAAARKGETKLTTVFWCASTVP
jgi:hypothetical protein